LAGVCVCVRARAVVRGVRVGWVVVQSMLRSLHNLIRKNMRTKTRNGICTNKKQLRAETNMMEMDETGMR